MYNSQLHKNPPKQNPYLTQKIMSASPEQLVVYIYDVAIAACGRQDQDKAIQAIHLLIKTLRFDDRQIANRFYQVYSAILEFIHRKNFDEARKMVAEIRETWLKAMRLE